MPLGLAIGVSCAAVCNVEKLSVRTFDMNLDVSIRRNIVHRTLAESTVMSAQRIGDFSPDFCCFSRDPQSAFIRPYHPNVISGNLRTRYGYFRLNRDMINCKSRLILITEKPASQ